MPLRRSCNHCIKAKSACDGSRPCARCLLFKLGDTCVNVERKVDKRSMKRDGLVWEDVRMGEDKGPLKEAEKIVLEQIDIDSTLLQAFIDIDTTTLSEHLKINNFPSSSGSFTPTAFNAPFSPFPPPSSPQHSDSSSSNYSPSSPSHSSPISPSGSPPLSPQLSSTAVSVPVPLTVSNDPLQPLPTLKISLYTRDGCAITTPFISTLLQHSPNQVIAAQQFISIPYCSSEKMVDTLSHLHQYANIDMNMPIHIDYSYKSVPLKNQAVGLLDVTGPTLVDYNIELVDMLGIINHSNFMKPVPIADHFQPEGIAISRKTVDLFRKFNTDYIERYLPLFLRSSPTRIFLVQHKLVGTRHRTVTMVEEFPDFPLCLFVHWIRGIFPNAVLPQCHLPYCHCKFPDENLD